MTSPTDDSPSPVNAWRDAWATRTEAPTEINVLAYEPTNGAEAAALANILWKSGMVTAFDRGTNDKRPASFHEIMMLMFTARAMGLTVMQGIAGLDIIEGRAVPRSRLLAALARQRADFVALKPVESTDEKAVWMVHRQGEDPFTVEYTIKDAQRAGLTGKKNWQRYPRTMLNQRCQSEAVNLAFPEVGLGMPASEEVLEDAELDRMPRAPSAPPARSPEEERGFTRGTSGPPRMEEPRAIPPPAPAITIQPIAATDREPVPAARDSSPAVKARFLRDCNDAGAGSMFEIEDMAIQVADEPDIARLTEEQRAEVLSRLKAAADRRRANREAALGVQPPAPEADEPPPPSDADRPPEAEESRQGEWGPDPEKGGAWGKKRKRG